MKIRKGKTPVLTSLQGVFRLAILANKSNAPPVDELIGMARDGDWSHRRFIENVGKGSLYIGTSSFLGTKLIGCRDHNVNPNKRNFHSSAPKIAIVGAGIAGLNTAYQLRKQGIMAQVYEAAPFVGGRIRTAYNIAGKGLCAELGGEFINSDHHDILQLVQELGTPLVDTAPDTLTKDVFWVDDAVYTMEES